MKPTPQVPTDRTPRPIGFRPGAGPARMPGEQAFLDDMAARVARVETLRRNLARLDDIARKPLDADAREEVEAAREAVEAELLSMGVEP